MSNPESLGYVFGQSSFQCRCAQSAFDLLPDSKDEEIISEDPFSTTSQTNYSFTNFPYSDGKSGPTTDYPNAGIFDSIINQRKPFYTSDQFTTSFKEFTFYDYFLMNPEKMEDYIKYLDTIKQKRSDLIAQFPKEEGEADDHFNDRVQQMVHDNLYKNMVEDTREIFTNNKANDDKKDNKKDKERRIFIKDQAREIRKEIVQHQQQKVKRTKNFQSNRDSSA